MFARVTTSDPLMQGDLIDDCPLVSFNLESGPIDWNDPRYTRFLERMNVR